MPFPLRDICKNPRSMYARVPQAMARFGLKIEKIVPYQGANPNTRNGARLRSPSPIIAPDFALGGVSSFLGVFRFFLGVFLVFLGVFRVFWGCSGFVGCSGMFRDVPVFRVLVFPEVLHAIWNG